MSRFPKPFFKFTTLVLTVFFALSGIASTCVADVAEDYRFAVELFNRKKWETASQQFKSIIDEYPGTPRAASAKFYYGFTLMELERYKDARIQLREFVTNSPKSKHIPDAKYRIGECSFHIGDHKTAENDLQSFIADHPKHKLTDWALSYLGDSQLALKKYAEAITTFQRIIKDFPKSELVEDGHWGLARVYDQTDRFPEALKRYREVATNGSIYQEKAAFKVGMIHLEMKKPEEAAAAFEKFPTDFPKSKLLSLTALNAGLTRYRLTDYQLAIDNFKKVAPQSRYGAQATRYSALANVRLKKLNEAVRILEDAVKTYSDDPSAESMTFTLGDTYRLSKDYTKANTAFLKVKTAWPKGIYAAKALHMAAECALLGGNPQQCADLLDEFDETFVDSPNTLKTRSLILRGRMLLNVGGVPNQKKAADILNTATTSDSDAATSNLAREYLVRALRSLGKHQQALNAALPLVKEILSGNADDVGDVILLAASSALQADENDEAIRLSTEFLNSNPESGEAYVIRARAEAAKKNFVKATSDLAKLKPINPSMHLTTVYQLANIAYDDQDYSTARELFSMIVDSTDPAGKSPLRPQALSGHGWCLFKLKQYTLAAAEFKKLKTEYPTHELTPEGSLMEGQSLKLAGSVTEAIVSLKQTFETYAPDETSTAIDPKVGTPQHHAFQAGMMAARLIGQSNVKAADTLWSRLAAQFPGSKKLDVVLEEWAFLNLEAGQYKRSDEVFTRLVNSVPSSPRVPRAKLVLAESFLLEGNVDQAESEFLALTKQTSAPEDVQETALFQLIRVAQDKEQWIKVEERAKALNQEFPESGYKNQAVLGLGEARYNLEDLESAVATLEPLRNELNQQPLAADGVPADSKWSGRLWVVLAEIQLIRKDYDGCRKTIDELQKRDSASPFLHQGFELLGRSYIRESPADFDKAREYFVKANTSKTGKGTRTAAKAQFMIGETWLFQKKYKEARKAYLRTSLVYPYPVWQAPALFQAARCEESLQKVDNAIMTYEELVKNHPGTIHAKNAQKRLKALRGESP